MIGKALLSLALASHATSINYAKILNTDQQIINDLTQENLRMKEILFGPLGNKVYPRYVEEKPYCPVAGFALQWLVDKSGIEQVFKPFCVRIK